MAALYGETTPINPTHIATEVGDTSYGVEANHSQSPVLGGDGKVYSDATGGSGVFVNHETTTTREEGGETITIHHFDARDQQTPRMAGDIPQAPFEVEKIGTETLPDGTVIPKTKTTVHRFDINTGKLIPAGSPRKKYEPVIEVSLPGVEGEDEQRIAMMFINIAKVIANMMASRGKDISSYEIGVGPDVAPVELQNKTVTATTSSQAITADTGYDGLGTVTVNAVTAAIDANIVAGNIKKDVIILGVTGTYEGPEEA